MKKMVKALFSFLFVSIFAIGSSNVVYAAIQSNNATVLLGNFSISSGQTRTTDYCKAIKTNMTLGFNAENSFGNYKLEHKSPNGSWRTVGSYSVVLAGTRYIKVDSKVDWSYRLVFNGGSRTNNIQVWCE
ncbi:hypothetical protein ACIP9C_17650 [Lysinibacillus sp. NPDC093210]|uniref:hypothetical protein n=1 Tax=Lysinibacillus sp. NPDC093210 TaxID=3364133 RepID=UPI00380B3B0D